MQWILACQYGEAVFAGFTYLDSQVSIGSGRIDVLLFQKEHSQGVLWIVECKGDTAGPWAVDQAIAYRDEIEANDKEIINEKFLQSFLKVSSLKEKEKIDPSEPYVVKAMVVSERYDNKSYEYASAKGARLISFQAVGTKREFKDVEKGQSQPEGKPRSLKISGCFTKDDWVNFIASDALKSEFNKLCNGSLPENERRRKSLVVQSKMQHIWVRLFCSGRNWKDGCDGLV